MTTRTESKISPKTVGWAQEDIKIALRDVKAGDGLPLLRVMGVANGFKQALDRNGNITEGLTGQFRAFSVKAPDDLVESGVLYMPGGLHFQIAGALRSEQATDRSAQSRFVIDVYARAASNQIGYEYYGQTKVAAERADVFGDLMKAAGDMPKITDQSATTPPPETATDTPAEDAKKK